MAANLNPLSGGITFNTGATNPVDLIVSQLVKSSAGIPSTILQLSPSVAPQMTAIRPTPPPFRRPPESYYSYYYNDDLVGQVPDPIYKYFLNAVDTDWNNLENWFEDKEGLIPSLTLPSHGDNVFIPNGVEAVYAGALTLRNYSTVRGSISANSIVFDGNSNVHSGATLTIYDPLQLNSIIFTNNSRFLGASNIVMPEDTRFVFAGTSRNIGQIAIANLEFRENSINAGNVFSSAKFYDYAANQSSVYGNAHFYGASQNSGTVYSQGFFYDYAVNLGNVFGGGAFDGIGGEWISGAADWPYNSQRISGTEIFGCGNRGSIGGSEHVAFRGSSFCSGFNFGGAKMYDNTIVYGANIGSPSNEAGVYLYDNSRFLGAGFGSTFWGDTIYGPIYKECLTVEDVYALTTNPLNENVEWLALYETTASIELSDITIIGGIKAQNIILNNCNTQITTLLIGNVTFNTEGITNTRDLFMNPSLTRGNRGEIRGNAVFNDYSYNWRQQGDYGGVTITEYPNLNSGIAGDIKEFRSGWITGDATFNDNTANNGVVRGNATFNNVSKNVFYFNYHTQLNVRAGRIKGSATYNDVVDPSQESRGINEGSVTINYHPFFVNSLTGPQYLNFGVIASAGDYSVGPTVYYRHLGCDTCARVSIDLDLKRLLTTGPGSPPPEGWPFYHELPTDGIFPLTGWKSVNDSSFIVDFVGSGETVLIKNENSL